MRTKLIRVPMVACLALVAATSITPAAAAAPPGYSVTGIDVSNHQGTINWSTVAAAGAKFSYAKASEGLNYTDPYFTANNNGAKGNGLYAGAYSYGRPDQGNPRGQAAKLLADSGYSNDGRTLPPMLDIEWPWFGGDTCYGLSSSAMVSWIRDFVGEIKARTGREAMIYTATSWWNQCTGSSGSFGANPLFIANYTGSPGTLPPGWSRFTLWQYSDSGSLPGDQDVFNGSLADLAALAGGPVSASAPTSGTRGDFNGDGYDDVAGLYDYGNSRTALFVWSAKPTGGFNSPVMQWDSGNGTWDQSRAKTVGGDFNHDGYTDLGAFYDYGNSRTGLWVWTAKATGGFSTPVMVWDSGSGTFEQPRFKAVGGDFNGDGRVDIGGFYDYGNSRTGLWVWTATSAGGFGVPNLMWDSGNGTFEQPRFKAVGGDFNGDGKADIGGFYDYGNSRTGLWVWTAKATGGFSTPVMVWDSGNGTFEQPRFKAVGGDFNGDGRVDIGGFYDYGNSRTGLWVWTATSAGGFGVPNLMWDSGNGTFEQPRIKTVSGDFTGDGRTDVGTFYDYGGSRTGLFTFTAQTGGGFATPSMAWDSGTGTWDQPRIKPF